ncbi:MAG: FAD-dependent thymidylate synthase [Phycisphaerae bacterium]|nr:FAD-dependent thymidylate synthase [Phycisphaerae bacterium]
MASETTGQRVGERAPVRVEAARAPADAAAPRWNEVRPETALVDVLGGASRREIRCLDHGFVALVDAMPRLVPQGQTADAAIVQAARVSYGQGTKKVNEDKGLIRYLLRHRHTTPFEMVEFKFHVAMPIFIARQWIRHRTANVNEYSGRYSVMPDRFYRPTVEQVRRQSRSNRQGGDELFVQAGATEAELATAEAFVKFLEDSEAMYQRYLSLTERGVSREMARMGLPVSLYTEWYWKCDLHNILRFLSLRMDAHAQEEIRVYARAMHDLIQPIVPVTVEAWKDYELESVRLSRLEIEALRDAARGGAGELASENSREREEWIAKRRSLGL